ncbi:hypothetical protein D9M70_458400 [compost metagenome]
MLGQGYASLGVILGVDVTGVGVERHLGVDDEVLALRQVDDHVWALATLFVGKADLALEVAALDQPGALQHVLQDQLTPITLGLLLPLEGGSQILGLLGDLPVELFQVQ